MRRTQQSNTLKKMGSKNLLELKTDPGKGKLTAKALPKQ
jgi:hypothetical protein